MRSDWQSHCLVITVWWTSIVFRLVETEACWASACSTNANLFHVDIISHCLLSNHNTCLIFFFFPTMKMFCLGVYFILAQRQAGRSEGTRPRSSVRCSTLRFVHLTWFLSDVVKCQRKKERTERTKARSAVSHWWRLFSARVTVKVTWYVSPSPPSAEHSSRAPGRQTIRTAGEMKTLNSRGRQ